MSLTPLKEVKKFFRNEYLSEARAAAFLSISRFALQGLRERKEGPPFYYYSKTLIRYKQSDLVRWMGERRITND